MAENTVVVEEELPEIEYEVVDDTPEKDKGRTAVKSPEPDEEELDQYSDTVKKRMRHLVHGYHDERRAKEAAEREREEAIKYANKIINENKQLKQTLNADTELIVATQKEKAAAEMTNAKRSYKDAYESGDADAIVDAQETLSKATINKEVAERWGGQRVNNHVEQQIEQEQPVAKPVQVVDRNAEDWAGKNPWYGPNKAMTALAFGVHEELLEKGLHPVKDAEKYYEGIDKAMRQRFPEYEWSESDDEAPQKQQRQAPTVVASVKRTSSGKKVVLTQTQVAIAKRLNVPLDLYAKQVIAQQERENG